MKIYIFLIFSVLSICFIVYHLFSMFSNNIRNTNTKHEKKKESYDLLKCHLKISNIHEIELLNELKNLNLLNKHYTTSDSDYYYNFGICKKALDSVNDDVGLIQIIKEKGDKHIGSSWKAKQR